MKLSRQVIITHCPHPARTVIIDEARLDSASDILLTVHSRMTAPAAEPCEWSPWWRGSLAAAQAVAEREEDSPADALASMGLPLSALYLADVGGLHVEPQPDPCELCGGTGFDVGRRLLCPVCHPHAADCYCELCAGEACP